MIPGPIGALLSLVYEGLKPPPRTPEEAADRLTAAEGIGHQASPPHLPGRPAAPNEPSSLPKPSQPTSPSEPAPPTSPAKPPSEPAPPPASRPPASEPPAPVAKPPEEAPPPTTAAQPAPAKPPQDVPPPTPRRQQQQQHQQVGVRIRRDDEPAVTAKPQNTQPDRREQQHQQQQGRTREARTRRRMSDRYAGGAELGLSRDQVDVLRGQVVGRERVGAPAAAGQAARPNQLDLSGLAADHRGAGSHFDLSNPAEVDIILNTINDPQAILVARNGSWIFWRNGTVVVTERGAPNVMRTAYGRGAHIPGRRINQVRETNPTKNVGDPEEPVALDDLFDETGSSAFDAFKIWP